MKIGKLTVYREWHVVRTGTVTPMFAQLRFDNKRKAEAAVRTFKQNGLWNKACHAQWHWHLRWGRHTRCGQTHIVSMWHVK